MISKLSRHDGSRLSATISLVLSVVLLVIGLFLTSIIFWPRPFRAWVRGPHPIKNVSLLGPMLLGIGYFGCMRLRKGGRSASGAVVRVGLGLAMIIVSSLPWLLKLGLPDKVPLEIFVFIGLPGLAVTAVGLADLWAQRCPSGSPHAEPAIAKPPRRASLLMLLIASVPGSVLMAFPVAAVYAFLISLPVPLVRGGAAAGLEGIRMSPLFVLIVVFFSGWPLLFIVGMGMCAAVAVACSRVRAQGLLMLALIALMEFIALAIWHSGLLGVVFSFFTR